MKIFCEFLRKQTMEIIKLKNNKMKLLTNEQHKSYENGKNIIFVK